MKLENILAVVLMAASMMACGSTSKNTNASALNTDDSTSPTELPLPVVPADLTTPAERANYVVKHFWDSLDVNNSVMVADTAMLEQAFVNFISIIPYAGSNDEVEQGIDIFFDKINGNPQAFKNFAEIIDLYLRDPNSPMRNDNLYVMMGQRMVNSPHLVSPYRERLQYNVAMANKNLEGNPAADFEYLTATGSTSTLYKTGRAPYLLVVFYDPDCDTCNEVERQIMSSETVATLLENKTLDILAVSVEGDESDWRMKIQELPANWSHGFTDGTIQADDLYDLRALPSIYLLDNEKRVILKDVLVNALFPALESL